MLFVVQYARHDVAAAFAVGGKGDRAQSYDHAHARRIRRPADHDRRVERAADAAARRRNGVVLPNWHHYYQFLATTSPATSRRPRSQAEQITAEDYPLGLVARAIAANRTGNADQARRALDRLIEVQPAWRTNARQLLEKSIYDTGSVDQLMRDLAAAGLASPSDRHVPKGDSRQDCFQRVAPVASGRLPFGRLSGGGRQPSRRSAATSPACHFVPLSVST